MTTQLQRIRAHLEGGKTITPMEAIAVYGIFRLSSVIEDLRATGVEVDCILKYDAMGKQYGEYRLRVPPSIGALVQVRRGYGSGLPTWVRRLKSAKVVGKYQDASLVSFISGPQHGNFWVNDREVVRVQ